MIPEEKKTTHRALERIGESSFSHHNHVDLLQDGPHVFGAWIEDIRRAQKIILLENYIVHEDVVGVTLVQTLVEKARQGVQVYVLYDWIGSLGTSPTLWRTLQEAGGQVQAFNPIQLSNPLQAIRRDHTKLLCIDGQVAFVGGLCVGDNWIGDPKRGIAPWRDTAVRIEGRAVKALVRIFFEMWTLGGKEGLALPWESTSKLVHTGDATVQIIHGVPSRARLYRALQTLFITATSRIWIADAYFILPSVFQEALVAAAQDGVDVRILVPRHSDLPSVAWVSRAGYADLLAAGIRIFEWEVSMLHAKTAVVDGQWSKIGSSNLTAGSLFLAYEIDVLIENKSFAQQMEEQFLQDLSRSNELFLIPQKRLPPRIHRSMGEHSASERVKRTPTKKVVHERAEQTRTLVARAGATVLGIALRRPLQQSTWSFTGLLAAVLLTMGGIGLWAPRWLGIAVTVLFLWLGIGFLLRAFTQGRQQWYQLRRKRKSKIHTTATLENNSPPVLVQQDSISKA